MSDTARPVSGVMHRIWISALLFGALAAILGVAMLVWPGPSIVVAAALFGAYLVISGVAMVVLAFALGQNPLRLRRNQLLILFGLGAIVYTGQSLTYFIALRSLPASLVICVSDRRHFSQGCSDD